MNPKDEYETLTKNKKQFKEDLDNYGEIIVTQRLKFSTGGMRGILREGFNGINEVTCNILCTALAKKFSSVTIAYDSRFKSSDFAMIAGNILKKNGKKVFVFDHIATPCLSYLVSVLKTEIGLMITASHNPKEYNGFKVYDKNGCQITAPLDEEISKELVKNETTDLSDESNAFDECVLSRNEAMIHYIKNMFNGWNSTQKPFLKCRPSSKILFTPLYGVSIDLVRLGVKEYSLEPLVDYFTKQCKFNPSFPNLPFPNPEVDQVYDEAKKQGYDLIFSCDPDGDRFGMIEKVSNNNDECVYNDDGSDDRYVTRYDDNKHDNDHNNKHDNDHNNKHDNDHINKHDNDHINNNTKYVHYCGDEIAAIFIKYFIENFDHSSLVFINTFLCNDFMEDVSSRFKIEYHRTETGFKNISKVINDVYEQDKVIFAYEDSLGFFFGRGREKDGIKCVLLMTHILQDTKPSNILSSLKEYGTYSTFNFHLRCENPEETLEKALKGFECKQLHDMFIKETEDYKLIMRKSGTEPIIKIYGSSKVLEKEKLKTKVMNFVHTKLIMQHN